MAEKHRYDLVVIGAGPAGQRAAIEAARLDKNVALVEQDDLGGAAVNTGTLPSKTLRETALYLSGLRQRGLFGVDYAFDREVTVTDLLYRQRQIVRGHQTLAGEDIARHSIELFSGRAHLRDRHTVEVRHEHGRSNTLDSDFVLLAVGSRPYHPPGIMFDGKRIYDSDSVLRLHGIPSSMVIVGAGIIGCEYATLFAALGVSVTVIDNDDKFLPMLDSEIAAILMERMRALGIRMVFRHELVHIDRLADGATVTFRQHEAIQADVALVCIGRTSNVAGLRLEDVGVQLGDRSCIVVDEHYRTTVGNIFAAGDVIGPPALASTSTEQGATAISHMFGQHSGRRHQVIPTGIYTIPEVAMIGESEETAASRHIAYEVGRAPYRTNARAAILGDTTGLLKLIFSRDTHVLVGVHVIGELASELVHIGQGYLTLGATIGAVGDTVFNFPTLSDLYKVAAEDGLRRVVSR